MSKLLPAVLAAVVTTTAAYAQTTPNSPPAPTHTAPAPQVSTSPAADPAMTMTADQARSWVDKVVYSSDGKNVGEVAEIVRDSTGKVTGMHADIGGFLGIGEQRAKIEPSQFKFGADRVDAAMTTEQVKGLPKFEKR